jgi:NADH-quinone oxidoreductase subunit M
MPSLKVWFFLATVASMATPGSLNWLGELLCITGTFETAPVAGILCSTTVILGAIYSIWLFNQIIGGHVSPYLALTNDLTYREWTLMIYLVVPAFILGVLPSIITNILTYSTIILVS